MESAVPEAAALCGRPVLPHKCQRTVKGRVFLRPGREILPLPRYCGGLSVGEAPHFQDLWLRADKRAVCGALGKVAQQFILPIRAQRHAGPVGNLDSSSWREP